MKSSLHQLFGLLLLTFISTNIYAQPGNDNVCSAIAVTLDDPALAIENTGATIESGEVTPPPGTGGNLCITAWCGQEQEVQNSVWFSFIAPTNGAVIINTCMDTTNIDTQIALWQVNDCADYGNFTFVVANDDIEGNCQSGNQYASNITVDGLTGGATYYVQVDGYDGAEGIVGFEVLTGVPTSSINFIHNSADASIGTVDIRVNGILIADDIQYQTCTGYVLVTADESSYITINPSTSEDDTTPLTSLTTTFNSTQNYVATITGIAAETGYTPTQPLSIAIFEGAQLNSTLPGTVDVVFFHGATDAPTVDLINGETSAIITNDLAYGTYNAEGYVVGSGESFSLMITDEEGNDLGYNYCIPLSQAGGFSLAFTMVISGFNTPSNNSDGQPLGVYLVNHFTGEFEALDAGMCPFPSNDDICDAMNLIVNDPPVTVNNSLATTQAGESSPNNLPGSDPESDCINSWCDGTLDNTLWFTFTAPETGGVQVTTCFDITIDTQISVCEVGDCNDFSSVTYLGSNDDMEIACTLGSEWASTVTIFNLTPGEVYHIHADGWEGETGEFQIQVTSVVSNVSENLNDAVSAFPNPASEMIQLTGMSSFNQIELRDINGKILHNGNCGTTSTIDVSEYASGVYTLVIRSEKQVITKKVIIE